MILPVLLGAGIGAAMGYFGQCTSGTCPLTSTWWRGAIYGGVMGLVFGGFPVSGKRTGIDQPGTTGKSGFSANAIKHVNAVNFDAEVLQSKLPVLVDFYAPWCGPCKAMSPVLESLAQEFSERARFLKVNVDETSALAERFNVKGVPTLIFFKDGVNLDQVVGLESEAELRKRLTVLAGSTTTAQAASL